MSVDYPKVIGEIYTASNQVLNLAVANTYYQIVGLSSGVSNNTTIASSRITVKETGYYSIKADISRAKLSRM